MKRIESALDQKRTQSLKRLIPDLFTYKSVLYIGARNKRIDYGDMFRENQYQITIVEIFKPNVKYLKTIKWIKDVIHADINTFKTNNKYDIVFWWHGPEHIEKSKLQGIISKLETFADVAVVLGCPWGDVVQANKDNNPYERHISYLDCGDFESMGYKTEFIGPKDIMGSNITAVKYIKKDTT